MWRWVYSPNNAASACSSTRTSGWYTFVCAKILSKPPLSPFGFAQAYELSFDHLPHALYVCFGNNCPLIVTDCPSHQAFQDTSSKLRFCFCYYFLPFGNHNKGWEEFEVMEIYSIVQQYELIAQVNEVIRPLRPEQYKLSYHDSCQPGWTQVCCVYASKARDI